MKRSRPLSAEERALWDKVAARTRPLGHDPVVLPATKPARPDPATPEPPATAAPPIPAFRVGGQVDHRADHDLLSGLSERLAAAPVRMDARTHGKLKRGKLRPEARIDLHGMTRDQAHPALVSFVMAQHAAGKRLILVITGKGKRSDEGGPIPERRGKLRHEVPLWLAQPPLGPLVLQVTEAHRGHGGQGALYVYLRRNR